MPPRNYLSGAAKRKKEAAELVKLSKHPKVSDFFQSQTRTTFEVEAVETHEASTIEVTARLSDNEEPLPSTSNVMATGRIKSNLSQPVTESESMSVVDVQDQSVPVEIYEEQLMASHSSSGYSNDTALWDPITEELRSYWVRNGPANCQNKECD